MVYFPVIREFDISGYQLYQNESNDGVSHSMPGGVHLIIGLNGLGKTTLLNAIYRLLIGPKDFPKSDDKPLGSHQHVLKKWKTNKYFSSRVEDGALDATIRANVSFGDRHITLTRKLSNLEVVSLSVDGQEVESSQDEYEKQVVELSGLADFIDFFSTVKYLLFFLEERSELIWDYRAQFEIFRILFYDREASIKAAEKYDEAQKADSRYRNIHAALKDTELALRKFDDSSTDVRAEYNAVKTQRLALDESINELYTNIENKKSDIEKLKLRRGQLKFNLDSMSFGIEEQQHNLYAHYFPNLDDTLKMLLSHLASGSGCLVCGNKDSKVQEKLQYAHAVHSCPICDAEIQQQEALPEQLILTSTESTEKHISKLQLESKKILHSIRNTDIEIQQEQRELHSLEEKYGPALESFKVLTSRLQRLLTQLPPEDADIAELERNFKTHEVQMQKQKQIRDKAEREYSSILETYRNSLREKMDLLRKRFSEYSKRLVAERVELRPDSVTRSIGQGGIKMEFPCLSVHMTSGVFKQNYAKRESPEAVSESQREFIDLAFRLALIDIVTHDRDAPAMIVMETPEASLDSMFMHEASLLFRKFAYEHNSKNVFLASTNLNKSEMIPALLGIDEDVDAESFDFSASLLGESGEKISEKQVGRIPSEDREKHIINLLELAAPNRTLDVHRETYDALYRDAVYPDGDENKEMY